MTSKHLIISLTTYGERIKTVHFALESLINQSRKADKIVLALGHAEVLSPELELMEKNGDIEILFTNDIGPYTKLIPTIKKYPNDLVITVDDDVLYPEDMVETLYQSHLANPNVIVTLRGYQMEYEKDSLKYYDAWEPCKKTTKASFDIFPTGVGGVLYFPGCFHEEVFHEELFLKLSHNADDIWFKAMTLKNGVKSKVIQHPLNETLRYIDGTQEVGLWRTENISIIEGNNPKIRAVFEHYKMFNLLNDAKCSRFLTDVEICDDVIQRFYSQYRLYKTMSVLSLGLIPKVNRKCNFMKEQLNKYREIRKEL